ncbi:hypothetical protein PanWU01x14_034980 [Parasponia andersonii]|uniref:Uncharacterized protein n=1 Tax=Parasponia andersonii TaxID=3476 RepID=A0A2P5DT26_PARAD|nr:hypothetical protein PanWU01x14_034980 [Parasponia andersonii]
MRSLPWILTLRMLKNTLKRCRGKKKSKDVATSEAVELSLSAFETSKDMEELEGKKYNRGVYDMLHNIWSLDKKFEFSHIGEIYVDQVEEWKVAEVVAIDVVKANNHLDAEIEAEFDESGHVDGEDSKETPQDM